MLRLFGPVRVEGRDGPGDSGVRREQAVLARLAAEARPVARSALAAWLWPDVAPAEARGRLRRLLNAMTTRFGVPLLAVARGEVALHASVLADSDLAAFRADLARGLYRDGTALDAGAVDALERAIGTARADFAEGLVLDECDEFAQWLARQREALQRARAQAAMRLALHYERAGLPARAMPHAQALVDRDPLDEAAQRVLIRMLAACAGPHVALDQAERCRAGLRAELGVSPEPETMALIARLAEPPRALDIAQAGARPDAVRYVRSGDVHLAWQTCGTGPLDVLVVSGFVSHLDQAWEPAGPGRFFEALADRTRVILYDRRGTGLSDRTVDPADTSDSVADAMAVLDAAGSRRAVVFAVSEGGPIGIRLAVEHRARVAGLALWGTLAKGTCTPEYPWALDETQYARWLATLVDAWGHPAGIEAFAGTRAGDPALRRWWTRTLRLGSSPRCIRGVLATLARTDVRALLSAVDVPTVVMHRSGDRAVRAEAGRYVADRIPGARFLPLAGDAHWWWLGDAAPILDTIAALGAGHAAHRRVS